MKRLEINLKVFGFSTGFGGFGVGFGLVVSAFGSSFCVTAILVFLHLIVGCYLHYTQFAGKIKQYSLILVDRVLIV
jgi:hypothetical protein